MKKSLICLIFLIVCTNNSFCQIIAARLIVKGINEALRNNQNIKFPDTLFLKNILDSPVIIEHKTDRGYVVAPNYQEYNDKFVDAIHYMKTYKGKTSDKYKKRINRLSYFINRYNDSIEVGRAYTANKILAAQRQQKSNDSIKLVEKQKIELQKKDTVFENGTTKIIDYSKITVAKDTRYVDTYGTGNNTFKLSPQILSALLMKNPTLKMLEATLPKWSSTEDTDFGHKSYETLSPYHVSVDYDLKIRKVNEIQISWLSSMQIKSFTQSLVANGFRVDASLSDLANAINKGVGGFREFYTKRNSPITFVLTPTQIKVFKSKY